MAKKDGLKFFTVQNELCEIIDGGVSKFVHADRWRHKWRPYKLTNGKALIFDINERAEATEICYEEAAARLSRYLESAKANKKTHKDFALDFDKCLKVVKAWAFISDHALSELPAAVAFAGDNGLCRKRFDFDPIRGGGFTLKEKAPLFYGALRRMTNAKAFCARIGSLFFKSPTRKQALWLYGPPDCGKSALSNMISDLVGEGPTVYPGNEDFKGAHWLEPFVGKKLCIVSEASTDFIKTHAFKRLTGERKATINPKGLPQYSAALECIVVFVSNDEPKIHGDQAALNRLIACEMKPIPAEKRCSDQELTERILTERPWVVGYCMDTYDRIVQSAHIPCNMNRVRELSFVHEHRYHEFADLSLEKGTGNDKIIMSDYNALARENGFVSTQELGKLRKIILRKFGAKEGKTRTGHDGREGKACIWGVRSKPFVADKPRCYANLITYAPAGGE